MLWIVLVCGGFCQLGPVRTAGWSAEFARAGYEAPAPFDPTFHTEAIWSAEDVRLGALAEARFATQRECLAALRQRFPAVRAPRPRPPFGELNFVAHARDHIELTDAIPEHMTRSYSVACFREAPRVS